MKNKDLLKRVENTAKELDSVIYEFIIEIEKLEEEIAELNAEIYVLEEALANCRMQE